MTDKTRHNLPRYSIGAASMAVSGYFLINRLDEPVIVIASFFFLVICAMDTLKTKIPNLACLVLTISGFAYNYSASGPDGLLTAFLGLLIGFSLLIVPHLMGGMGAGDVKALAALGSLLGPAPIFHVFVYTCLAGGLMALLHYLLAGDLLKKFTAWKTALLVYCGTRNLEDVPAVEKTEKLRFPYAAAIAFAYFSFLTWGGIM
jgi:prepilin peptidase CpaA